MLETTWLKRMEEKVAVTWEMSGVDNNKGKRNHKKHCTFFD
jgi:hypothetical protein